MDLKKFKFPKISVSDIVFPTQKTNQRLLIEATTRGFYNGHTPYNTLFSMLFFNGGKLNFKKDLPDEFKNAAVPYLKSFMGSFATKHEEKEAICAMLLSELVDV